jgi:hypothetical protein
MQKDCLVFHIQTSAKHVLLTFTAASISSEEELQQEL